MSRRDFIRLIGWAALAGFMGSVYRWRKIIPETESDTFDHMYMLEHLGDDLSLRDIRSRVPSGKIRYYFVRENPPWERVVAIVSPKKL